MTLSARPFGFRTCLSAAAVALISASAVLTATSGQASPRPVASPAVRTVTKTVTVQVAAPRVAPYTAALDVKPLANLTAGDRVLYGPPAPEGVTSPRQRCTWVLWHGSIDQAEIRCAGRILTVKTGFLTPVEPK